MVGPSGSVGAGPRAIGGVHSLEVGAIVGENSGKLRDLFAVERACWLAQARPADRGRLRHTFCDVPDLDGLMIAASVCGFVEPVDTHWLRHLWGACSSCRTTNRAQPSLNEAPQRT